MENHRMKNDPAYSGREFIGATQNYDEATAVIYGMPMDWTVSFRAGTRLGPECSRFPTCAIRFRRKRVLMNSYLPLFLRQ